MALVASKNGFYLRLVGAAVFFILVCFQVMKACSEQKKEVRAAAPTTTASPNTTWAPPSDHATSDSKILSITSKSAPAFNPEEKSKEAKPQKAKE